MKELGQKVKEVKELENSTFTLLALKNRASEGSEGSEGTSYSSKLFQEEESNETQRDVGETQRDVGLQIQPSLPSLVSQPHKNRGETVKVDLGISFTAQEVPSLSKRTIINRLGKEETVIDIPWSEYQLLPNLVASRLASYSYKGRKQRRYEPDTYRYEPELDKWH